MVKSYHKMKKIKVGLLVGRFQPAHKGHLYLIKQSFKKVDELIIGLGSANVINVDDILDNNQRYKMIREIVNKEYLTNRIKKIVYLGDYFDNEKWLKNALKNTGKIDLVIGNNEWVNGIFEQAGYQIWRAGFYKRYIFEGEKIRRLMIEGARWEDRVPEYLVNYIKTCQLVNLSTRNRLNHVVLGGTFDHFHLGHKAIIDCALRFGKKLSIGITRSNFYKNKFFSSTVENYETRENSVKEYLIKNHALERVKFIVIDNVYGPSIDDKTMDAIVATWQTFSNTQKINELRSIKNLRPLKIILTPIVKSQDGKTISSERIRAGEIDRNGHAYFEIFEEKEKLILPESLRETLRVPLGKTFKGRENELKKTVYKVVKLIKLVKPIMVIAVGDIVTISLVKGGFSPNISIVDLKSRRKELISREQNFIGNKHVVQMNWLKEVLPQNFAHFGKTENFAGTINTLAANQLRAKFREFFQTKKNQLIVIEGEEDLLALPAILLAPLGSLVLYGQWNLGVVAVEVTEEIKKKVEEILSNFK